MTTIGGAYVLYDLRPKIRIAEAGSLDNQDPFESQFTIINEGAFGLRDATAACRLSDVSTRSRLRFEDVTTASSSDVIGLLPAGESATVPCPFSKYIGLPQPVAEADVEIEIQDKYPL